ncbi:hypothetical protein JW921_10170, partial [Candidatus Fermentibacterales bacterium]|nr:hypothetical protein [Candidatus Fermentibacterales bacterium]
RPGHVFLPGMPREFPFTVEVELMPQQQEQRRQRFFLTWIVALLVVEGGVLYLTLRPLRKRMTRLGLATASLGSGRLGTRVEARPEGDLIDALGNSFNIMADRLEGLVSSHRELLSSVAHELRTPLARIGLALEMARESRDEPSRNEKLDRMEKDLLALDRLVSELLEYNRLSRPELESASEPVDLGELAREVGETERWGREDVEVTVSGTATLRGDRSLLARALGNLVRNACAHARTSIAVEVVETAAGVVLRVDDDGPGMPPSIGSRIGQPFLRGEASRPDGTGLGLAIVHRIALLHGGTLEAAESRMGGARLSLILPARG